MPIATRTIPQLTEKDKARFWAKVNKNGPTQPHMESPCWIWMAFKGKDGYGSFQVGGKPCRAHRIALAISIGEIPDGLVAMHMCDCKSCCNPDHIMPGTCAENIQDAAKKGLMPSGIRHGSHTCPESRSRGDSHYSRTSPHKLARGDKNGARLHPETRARGDRNGSRVHPERLPRGESHANSKLTANGVSEIRRRYALGGVTMVVLGEEFGVSFAVIQSVIKRRTWAHVD